MLFNQINISMQSDKSSTKTFRKETVQVSIESSEGWYNSSMKKSLLEIVEYSTIEKNYISDARNVQKNAGPNISWTNT